MRVAATVAAADTHTVTGSANKYFGNIPIPSLRVDRVESEATVRYRRAKVSFPPDPRANAKIESVK